MADDSKKKKRAIPAPTPRKGYTHRSVRKTEPAHPSNNMPATYQKYHLVPFDNVDGYDIRPGFYDINGATAIPGGVNFTVHTTGGTAVELLLYPRGESEDKPFAVIPFPSHYRIGNVFSMIVFGLNIYDFEYAYHVDGPYDPSKGLIFDKTKPLLDPYAKAVVGQSVWGEKGPVGDLYRARVVKDDFDWKDFADPCFPMSDLIIYEMHVRGFTKDKSSGVEFPGTFDGIREKIPYLKELGINAVELMPVFEFDETLDKREYNGRKLCNYWGYSTTSFFAPNTSYAAHVEYNREGNELKQLVSELNNNGIEVILDVVFNHTSEGNENGPVISFKGFDNQLYYMLTPEGFYYNFSGCGNTMNCSNPVVQQLILECLRYWVITYRVDGFRFDLASIMGRADDGSPMANPPLLQALAYDPILGDVKLIAEAWDAGGLYQVGTFATWNDRWAEWNGKYRDDIRKFLKGDEGSIFGAAQRLIGSPDIYRDNPWNSSINFITCHDGFTLYDLFAYNEKHNEANGWNNTDGSNDNHSWNCGFEGETDDPNVIALRKQMMKNAFAVLMLSRGTPMFLAGDEFGNTQFGNNNPYCQDNEISWLDWSRLKKNKDIFNFAKKSIAVRKEHPVLREHLGHCGYGFPETSFHGVCPWQDSFQSYDRYLGVMFAGKTKDGIDDVVYVAINSYWEDLNIEMPHLPEAHMWRVCLDSSNSPMKDGTAIGNSFVIKARSVVALVCSQR